MIRLRRAANGRVPVVPAPPATDADAVLDEARALEEHGGPALAIEVLTAANRCRRDPRVESYLVGLRHRAFPTTPRVDPATLPPSVASSPSVAGALPEVSAPDLDLDALHHGLATHGCVLVRGLIEPARAAELASGVDAALDGFDADDEGADGWYEHFRPTPGRYRVGGRRTWVRASGAVWTADSPRMLFELTELIADTGIGDLVTAYLGERPALSANKCTLRRVPLTAQAGWHQDGAFLGQDARTLNLWLSLADCGVDAPGLDIVPRRLDEVVPTGTEGAFFDWSVSPDVVAEAARPAPIVRPRFAPGDALLFDHLLLHATAVEPEMTRERHAIETWFFPPSAYPDGQIPLVY